MNEITDEAKPGISRPLDALVMRLARGVHHERVLKDLAEQGAVSGRYILLTILSAAIATLGMLLSSPAVVIGAMLVSPLMGPIVLLGLSFWRVDWPSTRRAMTSLVVGFAVAFVVAALLTWVSPLKEPTTEILARTRPNLFDLLVAVFSGVAGGYAVVRERGETVIGVAIATALMPPIAAIGFGVGVSNWPIALGALMLFTTNLIAIALAAGVVSALFGFRRQKWQKSGWLGHAAVLAVTAGLCVPLTLSLQTIAEESRATVLTHQQVTRTFGSRARLSELTVRAQNKRISVGGLVATPRFVRDANGEIGRRLAEAIGRPVDVTLGQIVLAHPERLTQPVAVPTPTAVPPDPAQETAKALHDAVPFATRAIAYDPASKASLVLLAAGDGLDLHAAHVLEVQLRARDGLSKVSVLPPVLPVPPAPLTIVNKAPVLGTELDDATWALARWQVVRVRASLCHVPRAMREPVRALLAGRLKDMVVAFESATRSACRARGATTPALVLVPA